MDNPCGTDVMALSPAETRELFLVGTVQFPACFPDLAQLNIDSAGVVIDEDAEQPLALPSLIVTERPHGLFVTRSILLCDLAAVFLPNDAKEVKLDDGEWLVGPQIQDVEQAGDQLIAARGRVQALDNPDGLGIVFAREDARVFNHIGFAAKASESVDLAGRVYHRNGCCGGFTYNGTCGG